MDEEEDVVVRVEERVWRRQRDGAEVEQRRSQLVAVSRMRLREGEERISNAVVLLVHLFGEDLRVLQRQQRRIVRLPEVVHEHGEALRREQSLVKRLERVRNLLHDVLGVIEVARVAEKRVQVRGEARKEHPEEGADDVLRLGEQS